jgi:TPR repeat protein
MKNKTSIISFDCPECGIPVKCTVDNWRTLCCQNCGESLSGNDICKILEKIQTQKNSTVEQKQAAKILYIHILVASEKYSQLAGSDWVYLLQLNKEYANKCNWDSLTGTNWKDLLISNPEYGEFCGISPESVHSYWKKITASQWMTIAAAQSSFKIISDLVNGMNVANHFASNPEMIKFCNWEKVSGSEWVQLIIASPDFASRCNWHMLKGKDWCTLLIKHPEFASKCAWDTIEDESFNLLCKHSERLKPYLNLSKLPSSCFYRIVEKMNLGDAYDWSNISSGQEWVQILLVYPGLSKYCNWSTLNSKDWVRLLIKQPQFKSICDWKAIKSEDWDDLLTAHPNFMIFYPKRLKDVWNYESFFSRSALGKVLSRFFVFLIANTFLTIFSFFSIFGDDGWFSLARENFLYALTAGGAWIVLYVGWALLYSKAWAGEYKRWLQITTTFFMSACFYTIYSWTFFFSRCSFAIVFLTIIAIIFLFLPYKCSAKAQKILLLISPVFLFFTFGILVPGQNQDYYQIGKQLESSPFVFKRAARLYYEKGYAIDPQYSKWEKNLKENINNKKWQDAEKALSELLKINPFYPEAQKISATIADIKIQSEKALAEKKRLATKDALQYFSEEKYVLAHKCALQGDMSNPKLLLAIAWMYEFCETTLQDITKADTSYYQAAQTGDADAQCAYALFLCRHPKFAKKDKLKNPEFLLTSAIQQGNIDARLHLGKLLLNGIFVEKNISKALEITLPIAKNNAKAAKFVARIFADSNKGFGNKKQADYYYSIMMRLLIDDSENDNAESLYLLGESFEKGEGCDQSLRLAFNYYDRAASLESKPAMLKLAQFYEYGHGTEINYGRALELYQRLALKNNAEAYFALGNLYAAGLGCEKSEKMAVQWLEKALKSHYVKAADSLALLYYFGKEMQNYKQAFYYANMAATQGYPNSQFLLGNFYTFGHGDISVNTQKAFEWYMKAAEQNHADAQYNIGYMYENGDAGSVDLVNAKLWFKKSADNGNLRAKEKLKNLSQQPDDSSANSTPPEPST